MRQLSWIGLLSLFSLCGCATVTRSPVPGFLYTETTYPMMATSNPAGNRLGVACEQSILGLFATGDASIEAARRNGGITLITSVDETANSVALVYAKHCVVVRGR
jgi:hypothetical protein